MAIEETPQFLGLTVRWHRSRFQYVIGESELLPDSPVVERAEQLVPVSNPLRSQSTRCFMKTPIFLALSFLAFTGRTTGQTPTSEAVKRPALAFQARPTKHLFARGEDVVFTLQIRNESAGRVFVSRLIHDEFVDFKISGPDGKEVSWRGKGRIDSKRYSPSDFAVLRSGEKISAKRIISLENGQGFVFSKSGQYSVTAEYSLEPPEYFAPFAGDAKIPPGSFRSINTTFCVELCGPNSQK